MGSTSFRANLAFTACWCGFVAGWMLDVPAAAIVFGLGAAVALFVAVRASWREGRARTARDPITAHGFERHRVARALNLSGLLPGLGEYYLEVPRSGTTVVAFLVVAIPVWAGDVPYVVALPVAGALWLWAPIRLRRLTGYGWSPLLPSWNDMIRPR